MWAVGGDGWGGVAGGVGGDNKTLGFFIFWRRSLLDGGGEEGMGAVGGAGTLLRAANTRKAQM